MADEHVPGAAVVRAHDGHALFARGYGDADLERRTPRDPDRTSLRVASVAKSFIFTALLQLHDRRLFARTTP